MNCLMKVSFLIKQQVRSSTDVFIIFSRLQLHYFRELGRGLLKFY